MERTKHLFVHFITMFFLIFITACGESQKGYRFLIPDHYEGWLFLVFNTPDAPELIKHDGFRIVKFPPSGVLKTSDSLILGKVIDEYYYYKQNNLKPFPLKLLGGSLTVKNVNPSKEYFYLCFWVGKKQKDIKEWASEVPVPKMLYE